MNKAEASIYTILIEQFPLANIQVSVQDFQIRLCIEKVKMNCWIDEWNDKQAIVMARIQSMLGKNKRVHGRACTIQMIDKKTAEIFLNKHHVLGYVNAYYKLGLFKNNELLAMATFSKGRKMNRLPENKKSFELIRFTNASGITVVGGLSKLLHHFINLTGAGDIMTYIDKEQSEGKSFIKLGFKLIEETEPIHFLMHKTLKKRMTKTDINTNDDYVWVKNSGNLKLVFTPHP